ncbi:MAG: sulfatase [Bryobacteraceae bacterium]
MHARPNVILIVEDSLRADHLGCYGYRHATSPAIDRMAAEGVRFENMFCSGLPTHPAFTTLHAGQHPITHGIVSHNGKAVFSRTTPVLPEIFMNAGYTTCAFDNLIREKTWLGRGFEFVIDPGLRRVLTLLVTREEIHARALPWLRTYCREPLFVLLHYWDCHAPYVPPQRYRGMFYSGNPTDPDNHGLDPYWEQPLGPLARDTWLNGPGGRITDPNYVTALYDQCIRYADDGVAELLDEIDQLGIAENTLIVFTADHGESLTDHGLFFEHVGLYDCTLRVPFIMRWPGRLPAGRTVPDLFEMRDVAPTLLEAVGLHTPPSMNGTSFWAAATGAGAGGRDRVFGVESTWQGRWSLRTRDHKFILGRETGLYGKPLKELYDLRVDPGETNDLAATCRPLAESMEASLEAWIQDRLAEAGRKQDPLVEQGLSLRQMVPIPQ